jgi:hypothetical protein
MISVLEAFNSVLKTAKSQAPDHEKRASVAAEIKLFNAGNPTDGMCDRLGVMLATSAMSPEVQSDERNIFKHAFGCLRREHG